MYFWYPDSLADANEERLEAAAVGVVKTSKLTRIVQPRLADFVFRATTAAYDKALRCSTNAAAAMGLSEDQLAALPATHPAHMLNNLHRALGFAGCPTAPVWPSELHAFPCVPIVGLNIPDERGVQSVGALVGCSIAPRAFPFTSIDDPNGVFAIVELPVGSAELVRDEVHGAPFLAFAHISLIVSASDAGSLSAERSSCCMCVADPCPMVASAGCQPNQRVGHQHLRGSPVLRWLARHHHWTATWPAVISGAPPVLV